MIIDNSLLWDDTSETMGDFLERLTSRKFFDLLKVCSRPRIERSKVEREVLFTQAKVIYFAEMGLDNNNFIAPGKLKEITTRFILLVNMWHHANLGNVQIVPSDPVEGLYLYKDFSIRLTQQGIEAHERGEIDIPSNFLK